MSKIVVCRLCEKPLRNEPSLRSDRIEISREICECCGRALRREVNGSIFRLWSMAPPADAAQMDAREIGVSRGAR